MIYSTFILSVLGLIYPLAISAENNRISMTMDQLHELWGMEKPEFGRTPEGFEDIGSSRRRLGGGELEFPERYYERCVFWINAARATEGLPALKRWKDFEPCSDRTAKYDSVNGVYHGAIQEGLFCDWEPYFPIGQNTCPLMHDVWGSSRLNQECTMTMWSEKHLLETRIDEDGNEELKCKNGQNPNNCAGHYVTLRGGVNGYNAYDRVACGFHQNGNLIWINQNYGSGIKTKVEELKPANQWTAPKDWVPQDFVPYGFQCGGDAETKPVSFLVDDCLPMDNDLQYNDCSGVAREDYRWWGCTYPTCDAHLNVNPTQLCETQPFDFGFAPTPAPIFVPTEEPTEMPTVNPTPAPEPTPNPTDSPTLQPSVSAGCDAVETKRHCKNTAGCMWQRKCKPRAACETISKSNCKNANNCFWNTSVSPKVCSEQSS